MKAILFFSMIFFLIGCGKQPQPKLQYIKPNCPKLIILKSIKNDQIEEVKLNIIEKDGKYLVDKKELKKASFNSQKKSILIEKQKKYIKFYEAQVRKVRQSCNKK